MIFIFCIYVFSNTEIVLYLNIYITTILCYKIHIRTQIIVFYDVMKVKINI